MYNKKTIILKEYDARFSYKGKLGGVLTLLCDGTSTKCRLDLYNADIRRYGEFLLRIRAGQIHSVYVDKLRGCLFELAEKEIDRVSAVLFKIEDKSYPIAHGSNYLLNADTSLMAVAGKQRKENISTNKLPSVKQAVIQGQDTTNSNREKSLLQTQDDSIKQSGLSVIFSQHKDNDDTFDTQNNSQDNLHDGQQQIQTIPLISAPHDMVADKCDDNETQDHHQTAYEKFVLACDNYYEKNESTGTKALSQYLSQMEKYILEGKGDYFSSVSNHLTQLFEYYPPYRRLMQLQKDSVWIKIEREKDRYFCLGLLIKEGEPCSICYAVPKRNMPFNFSDFHIIYQDASNGKLTQRPPS